MVNEKNKKKARLSWYHPDDTVCAALIFLFQQPLNSVISSFLQREVPMLKPKVKRNYIFSDSKERQSQSINHE